MVLFFITSSDCFEIENRPRIYIETKKKKPFLVSYAGDTIVQFPREDKLRRRGAEFFFFI